MSILGFIIISLKSFFLGLCKKTKGYHIPESVEGYKLLSILREYPYFVGIYGDEAGKKVIVKAWHGSYKNTHYYLLMHGIRMHTLFEKVLQRVELPEAIGEVRIPRLLYTRAEKERLIVIREYVEGISPRFLSDSCRKIGAYQHVVDFMHFLGAQLTTEERRSIPVRTIGNLILIFPLIAAYACWKRPKMAKEICRGVLGFFSSIPALVKNTELMLAHKDLHLNNIILNNDSVYVIDFDSCTFTNPMYEYVITLPIEWRDAEFRDALIRQIRKGRRFREPEALFRGLALHRGIHGITGNCKAATIDKFRDFLQYAAACR